MTIDERLVFVREIARALKLTEGAWTRVVIVADVNDIPRVYVKGYLCDESVPGIVRAVKNVTVTDDGEVSVVFAEEVP